MTKKETEQVQIVIDPRGLEIKTTEYPNGKLKLEFEKISDMIKSTFEIEKPEYIKVFKPLKMEYYTLIESTKVNSFKKYSEFLIIEFVNQNDTDNEFKKIKTIA